MPPILLSGGVYSADIARVRKRLALVGHPISFDGVIARLRVTRPSGPSLDVGAKHWIALTDLEAKALGVAHAREPSVAELVARGVPWAEIDRLRGAS